MKLLARIAAFLNRKHKWSWRGTILGAMLGLYISLRYLIPYLQQRYPPLEHTSQISIPATQKGQNDLRESIIRALEETTSQYNNTKPIDLTPKQPATPTTTSADH